MPNFSEGDEYCLLCGTLVYCGYKNVHLGTRPPEDGMTVCPVIAELAAAKDKLQYVQEYRFYEKEVGKKKGRGSASVMRNINGDWCLWHHSDFVASFGQDLESAICRAKKLVGIP